MEKYTEYNVECKLAGNGGNWHATFTSSLLSDAMSVLEAKRTLASIFKEPVEYRLLSVTTERIS